VADIKLSERKHPLYEENENKWDFYFDSAIGGDNIANSDNIFEHRLEDAEDHDDRIERAYYLNFCDTIPSIYNSFIFRESITRPPDEVLQHFRKNADGRGLNITNFVKKAGYYASIYGAIHALVDLPPTTKKVKSKRDVKSGEIAPYASLVFPSQLVDWSVDSWGELRWIVLWSTYYNDEDPGKERVEEQHYKLITRDEWRIENEDGVAPKLADGVPNKGKNEWGLVPLVTMYHKDINNDRIGESMIKDIAYINRAILNWCSCIDEQIERQTFSQLVIPDDGTLVDESESGGEPLRKVGTSSVWTFPHDAGQPPQFISPNTNNIKVVWDIILDHIKEIYRIAKLIGGTGDLYASRSGRAAQMGFQGVNAALAEKSMSYEKFENDLNSLIYYHNNKSIEELDPVKYPSTFDVAALADELDDQLKLMEKNFSPTLNKTLQKNLARKAVPLAPESIRLEIEKEIDAGSGVVESAKANLQEDGRTGEDGNPNVNNLSNTFRGTTDKEEDEVNKQKKEE